jgi:hypothetical protein
MVVWAGSVAYYMGALAALLGNHEDACWNLRYAVDADSRTGGRPQLARTRLTYASALASRGRREDIVVARQQVADALAMAQQMGMCRVEQESRALAAELG